MDVIYVGQIALTLVVNLALIFMADNLMEKPE